MAESWDNNPSLQGARILVVEDEWIVASFLKDVLDDCGCELVGPANRVAKANALAAAEILDGALLDLNVAGETVYAVANTLAARGVPFAFVTGYTAGWINETYRDRPALQKPIHPDKLKRTLAAMVRPRAG